MDTKNARNILITRMDDLDTDEINCSKCIGVCCTDLANSMKIDTHEVTAIYQYLKNNKLWTSSLKEKLEETISKYRLDQEISTGKNSVFRKTYTCPFFGHTNLGCSLPKEVKPYGCLAFNPKSAGIEKGGDCSSDPTLLEGIEQEEEREAIPLALLNHNKKVELLESDLIISHSTNPYHNLALEDFLLRETKDKKERLLIWRNEPCIVFGKFQNPWLECDLEKSTKLGLKFVRRLSGGGTVYHDLGNLNYSYFTDNGFCNRQTSLDFIIAAFEKVGIEIKKNERNDLVLENEGAFFKISGSAFKQIKDYGYHHGTLLLNAELSSIRGTLSPQRKGIETKAISSVSSSVKNISEINPQMDYLKGKEILSSYWRSLKKRKVTEIQAKEFSIFNSSKFSSWEWIWGQTPKFSFKNNNLSFNSQKGVITDVKSLDNDLINKLNNKKIGIPYPYSYLDLVFNRKEGN